MNFSNITQWNNLPRDTQRLLHSYGYNSSNIASVPDEELLRIEGLGPKKLTRIRLVFPYRAQFQRGNTQVNVHATFDVKGEFGTVERDYLDKAVSTALQKLCKQRKASPDNFQTKVGFVESRVFERAPRAVLEVDEQGILNAMSDIPLEIMAINKNPETIDKALKSQRSEELSLIPSNLDKRDPVSCGLFAHHESDVLPEDVERYFEYTTDKPEVDRYARTVLRLMRMEGGL